MVDYLQNPFLVITLTLFYLYSCMSLKAVTTRLGMDRTWTAWVPVLNLFLYLRIAARPGWWMLLALAPFVNIAVITYVFMVASERLNRPAWWGLSALLPPVGLVVLGILGFGRTSPARGAKSMPATGA